MDGDSSEFEGLSGGELGTDRLEAFSDGVFAVVITLTAIDLRVPAGSGFAALSKRLPEILIYILSFVFLGIYWNNHHHLLRTARRINGAVMWTNLFLLFWLSLIPVLTQWVGEHDHDSVPAASYGIVVLASALAYTTLVRAIIRADPSSVVARAIGRDRKGIVSLFVYVVGIGVAFASPWAAYGIYALVAILWFIPDRRLSRPGTVPPGR